MEKNKNTKFSLDRYDSKLQAWTGVKSFDDSNKAISEMDSKFFSSPAHASYRVRSLVDGKIVAQRLLTYPVER